MSVIIDTTMSEVESVMKYARYGANNCMIGNGWEIKELVRCKECRYWQPHEKGIYGDCMYKANGYRRADFFCADAERRSE